MDQYKITFILRLVKNKAFCRIKYIECYRLREKYVQIFKYIVIDIEDRDIGIGIGINRGIDRSVDIDIYT